MLYALTRVIVELRSFVSVVRMGACIAGLMVCCAGCADDTEKPAGDAGRSGSAAAGRGGGSGSMLDDDGGMTRELCASCGGCAETIPVLSRTHVTGPIEYPDPPPAGGDHDPCWAKWGVHTDTVATRNWVHNLEHGGVVFLYDCPDGCDTDLAALTALAKTNQRTLLTRYPGLRTRFALVAWGKRLLSDCVDVVAFQAFYDASFNHGPEAIGSDPPSSCPTAN